MSYYANSREADFFIRKENFHKVVVAVTQKDSEWLRETPSIEHVFEAFGFFVEFNGHGDLYDVWYEHEKFHGDDLEKFFNAIAPFVVAGSYITFEGEDSSFWAYYFDGKMWEEYAGEITFPGMPMDGPKLKM